MSILDIIQCLVYYLKYDVSKTGFCLRLQAEPTQLGPIERATLYLRTGDGNRIQSPIFVF
jgi:hypothetical protein